MAATERAVRFVLAAGISGLHESLGDGCAGLFYPHVHRVALGVVGAVGHPEPRAGRRIQRSRRLVSVCVRASSVAVIRVAEA